MKAKIVYVGRPERLKVSFGETSKFWPLINVRPATSDQVIWYVVVGSGATATATQCRFARLVGIKSKW